MAITDNFTTSPVTASMLATKQDKITASGVLQGDGNGGVSAKTVDSSPTANSTNLVTSGGVKSAITKVENDLASIHATGSTNTTGATITKNTYFYLNNVLVQAKADIAVNASYTSGTNYETVTAGGLNDLKSAIFSWSSKTPIDMQLNQVNATYTAPSDGVVFIKFVSTYSLGSTVLGNYVVSCNGLEYAIRGQSPVSERFLFTLVTLVGKGDVFRVLQLDNAYQLVTNFYGV